MALSPFDIITFVVFIAGVVAISLYASRKEESEEDYFLAGRKLTWGLIGFSLIASNISTEHFVGMAGQAFSKIGLAIASYEWMAAVTLVIVAWWLLPRFLSVGIYTMPEFLEYRYDRGTRTIMATYLLGGYVFALLATVLYSGAQGLNGIFGFPELFAKHFNLDPEAATGWARFCGIWTIGIIAGAYTIYGGLKAVVWSDLIQGGALLLGGAIVMYLGLKLTGGGEIVDSGGVVGGSVVDGWRTFREANADKLHVIRPWNDPDVPWLAVLVGGLWIPNLFYWGLNQFITQRTLGAKSLYEGQKGIYLACFFKLIIPFIIVMPGIMAFQFFGSELLASTGNDVSKAGELAYPYMISKIMPPMFRGVMLAALAGAVMSTFNSGINSASTIFTIDLYNRFVNKDADAKRQVFVGRIATAVIAIIACLAAPLPGKFEGVFSYIQEIWGFISPGIVAAFLFGLWFRKAPAIAGRVALLLGPVLYAICRVPGWIMKSTYAVEGTTTVQVPDGILKAIYNFSNIAFLHHMAIIFIVLMIVMGCITAFAPRTTPITYPRSKLDVHVPTVSYVWGTLILLGAAGLYIVFW